MSWNGSGTYVLPPAYSPELNGTIIDALRYNGLTTDVAQGITAALAKNGENSPTGNLPMGSFKHTGAADAVAVGEYLVYGQVSAVLGSLSMTGSLSAGGTTVTGLSVRPSSAGDGNLVLSANGTGQYTFLSFFNSSTLAAQLRWQFYKDNGAESGSNAGSNFSLNAYTDAGAYLNTPFSIARATGVISITVKPAGAGINALFSAPPANIGGTTPVDVFGLGFYARNGANGRMAVRSGGPSNSGYIEFECPTTFVRQGYIGFSSTSSTNDAGTIPYVAGTHAFSGTVTGSTPSAAVGTNTGAFASTAYAYVQAFGGSTWQDVTGSRAKGTTYTNSTGKPIAVNVTGTASTNGARYQFTISSVVVGGCATQSANQLAISVVVPPGATYTLADGFGTNAVVAWTELR